LSKHRREDSPFKCMARGHEWVSNGWTGKSNHNWDEVPYRSHTDEIRDFYCASQCGSHKYELTNWDRELTREERMVEILRFRDGTRAMIWLLDNVQPAYSSDGAGYEQEGGGR
jgi:hypothetical protein